MKLTIGLAQAGFPTDGDVLAQIESFAAEAEAQGVQLLAFPEDLMCPKPMSAHELRELAEPLDGPFAEVVSRIAASHDMWIVGTMFEQRQGMAPYNTAFVMDSEGALRANYRKCHLYDAHGVFESQRTSSGSALMQPISTPFGTLALGICYDLRFPEVARAAATAGAEMLLLPSCWYDGPHKSEHWETLLKARAIENELFVAGICHAGAKYVEHSLLADPLGRIVTPHVAGEALIVAQIETDDIKTARSAMPVLEHRRPELYR